MNECLTAQGAAVSSLVNYLKPTAVLFQKVRSHFQRGPVNRLVSLRRFNKKFRYQNNSTNVVDRSILLMADHSAGPFESTKEV